VSHYIDGYIAGQHDALSWLEEAPTDEPQTLGFFDDAVKSRAAMVCLAANLRTAAGLCAAYWDGVRCEAARHVHAPWLDRDWRPGCGRPVWTPSDDERPARRHQEEG
jgi:hypothetical protein